MERRIVTVEDPVEHKLGGVMQIAIKPEINLTFATALRSILRGDPNVIMIGEMRDFETAEIANPCGAHRPPCFQHTPHE